jgi:hypothetical protein
MSTVQDLWYSYLTGEGYGPSSVQDMLRAALIAETGGSELSTISELWRDYLIGEGYSGGLVDMQMAWLADKGYTGTLEDRWYAALSDGDVFEVEEEGP